VNHEMLTVVVGGDALALKVCYELAQTPGGRIAVLWKRDDDLREQVERLGGSFHARSADEGAGLLAAGVREAAAVIAVGDDDHLNLEIALRARDLNPEIRVVLSQFSRTLARKIEQNLANCSVISPSTQSAATYASAAVDPACYYGVQFPEDNGALAGFSRVRAGSAGVGGCTQAQAEAQLEARIVARNGLPALTAAERLADDDELVVFACVRPQNSGPQPARPSSPSSRASYAQRMRRALRHLDPVSRGVIVTALVVFVLGCFFFGSVMHLDPLTAAYFVVTTMSTTGFGDISPLQAGSAGMVGSIVLMIAGVTLTGLFIAILSSRLTQAQYVAVQGLRRVSRRGHIIVCGSGNVGSRVIDFLLKLERDVVVVELDPKPEIVERARDLGFDLLTGDATKDTTLDLCNVVEAAALIALTNTDTMNLEVALGARARNADLTIVMRVQHEDFQKSVRRHFGLDRTYGTAALAAPVLAGLSRSPEVRGNVTIGEREYAVVELRCDETPLTLPATGCVPLGTWRDGRVVMLSDFADVQSGERVLLLVSMTQFRGPLAAWSRVAQRVLR